MRRVANESSFAVLLLQCTSPSRNTVCSAAYKVGKSCAVRNKCKASFVVCAELCRCCCGFVDDIGSSWSDFNSLFVLGLAVVVIAALVLWATTSFLVEELFVTRLLARTRTRGGSRCRRGGKGRAFLRWLRVVAVMNDTTS